MARFNRTPSTAWGMARRIEENYARQVQRLTISIGRRLRRARTVEEVRRLLLVISNDPEFNAYCEALAMNMANRVFRSSEGNWRRAAQEVAHRRGRLIFEELQRTFTNTPLGLTVNDIVMENAQLIKTLPSRLDAQLATIMAKESAIAGVRHETLTKNILDQFFGGLEANEYKARRIARTETGKAHMALTQARAQSLGLNWYIWRTAQDGDRVRVAHRHMEGVLVSYNDPPNPETLADEPGTNGNYHAGCIFNCRCFAEPIIDLDWIEWPRQVHVSGTIRTMTRAQFNALAA